MAGGWLGAGFARATAQMLGGGTLGVVESVKGDEAEGGRPPIGLATHAAAVAIEAGCPALVQTQTFSGGWVVPRSVFGDLVQDNDFSNSPADNWRRSKRLAVRAELESPGLRGPRRILVTSSSKYVRA